MKVSYRRDLNKSFMAVVPEEGSYEDFELQMLRHNQIKGILSMLQLNEDGEISYIYDISGHQALDNCLRRKNINAEFIRRLMEAICEVSKELQNFLLDEQALVIQEDMIFVSPKSEFRFAYLPGRKESVSLGFQKLMEQVLGCIDGTDQNCATFCYRLYQKTLEDNFTLSGFLEESQCQAMENRDLFNPASICNKDFDTQGETSSSYNQQHEPSACQNQLSGEYFFQHPDSGKGKNTSMRHKLFSSDPEPKQSKHTGPEGFMPQQSQKAPVESKGSKLKDLLTKEISFKNRKKTSKAATKPDKQAFKKESIGKSDKKSSLSRLGKWILGDNPKEDNQKKEEEYSSPVSDYSFATECKPMMVCEDNVHPTVFIGAQSGKESGRFQYQGFGRESDFEADKDEIYIGTNLNEVDIVLHSPTVSRIHARVLHENDGYFIEDMNSTNGTFVNDIQLEYRQKRQLSSGDIVRLGDVRFCFY